MKSAIYRIIFIAGYFATDSLSHAILFATPFTFIYFIAMVFFKGSSYLLQGR